MTATRSRPVAIAIAIAFVALAIPVLVHLAGQSPEPRQATSFADSARSQLVTSAHIAHHPAGSPERVVLEWWREVQYRNPQRAVEYYAPGVRPSVATFARQLREIKANVRLHDRGPMIEGTAVRGRSANVRTLITAEARIDADHFNREVEPQAFNLRRTPRGWKLADNYYLDSIVLDFKEEAARKQR